jgi:hypothetical protein
MLKNCWNRTDAGLYKKGNREKGKGEKDMKIFIEQQIINAVQELLSGKVNEALGELNIKVPLIEFGQYCSESVIVPVIELKTCECTEKERIIRMDAYLLTISFNFPDTENSDLFGYAYSAVVKQALIENPTLGNAVDRAIITGKKYENNKLILSLRLTVRETV